MEKVARLPAQERLELLIKTAERKRISPAAAEKDFWITWTLDRLFQSPYLARQLMFKGGTSLSKVYNLINRFSEDIDLILDWRVLIDEDPMAERSKTKQARLNAAINEHAQHYISVKLLELVRTSLAGVCDSHVDNKLPHVINVEYPAIFTDDYLHPNVRLEIGPLAAWLPFEKHRMRCYAAEVFPDAFTRPDCIVKVIRAERTFWEKATILHHEAHRPEDSHMPHRYSRHYYDMAMMAKSPIKAQALSDPKLLADVVEAKQRFYPRGWARYDLAKPGSLVLMPQKHFLDSIMSDYQAMDKMIFGEMPDFEDILATILALQEEINAS